MCESEASVWQCDPAQPQDRWRCSRCCAALSWSSFSAREDAVTSFFPHNTTHKCSWHDIKRYAVHIHRAPLMAPLHAATRKREQRIGTRHERRPAAYSTSCARSCSADVCTPLRQCLQIQNCIALSTSIRPRMVPECRRVRSGDVSEPLPRIVLWPRRSVGHASGLRSAVRQQLMMAAWQECAAHRLVPNAAGEQLRRVERRGCWWPVEVEDAGRSMHDGASFRLHALAPRQHGASAPLRAWRRRAVTCSLHDRRGVVAFSGMGWAVTWSITLEAIHVA